MNDSGFVCYKKNSKYKMFIGWTLGFCRMFIVSMQQRFCICIQIREHYPNHNIIHARGQWTLMQQKIYEFTEYEFICAQNRTYTRAIWMWRFFYLFIFRLCISVRSSTYLIQTDRGIYCYTGQRYVYFDIISSFNFSFNILLTRQHFDLITKS